MTKPDIIAQLGESTALLPSLIKAAIGANDRLKLRLTLLQDAVSHAADSAAQTPDLECEARRCGLAPALAGLVSQARSVGGSRFAAPGLAQLVGGFGEDLRAMLAPLEAARAEGWQACAERLEALCAELPLAEGDALDAADVVALTAAGQDGPDTVHRFVIDLHRAVNRLAAALCEESVGGARAYGLTDEDRPRLMAFMRGLNRTAPLAFGHPGLGTLAARTGATLTIQNDIGETDAHVLIVHIEGRLVTITYTDVHRRRAKFFVSMLDGEANFGALGEPSNQLGNQMFYLVAGRFEGKDAAALEAFLELLGSRIVFLIDWNRARKALETLVDRDSAISILAWAADQELGHRAFLALGGADLVFEAVRRGAEGRIPYGVKLSKALGAQEAAGFLHQVLRAASEGLNAGRSAGLIRDEIQADLGRRFETAETAVLAIVVRHLGLSRTLASAIQDALEEPSAGAAGLAARAKRLEAKADRLTVRAREVCSSLVRAPGVRTLVDAVEDAMDALDEGAFLMSLGRPPAAPALRRLADSVADAVGQMVRAAETASRARDQRDIDDALQALDAVMNAEHDADDAERAATGDLATAEGLDARSMVLGMQTAGALETATDHLAHAALALRARLLQGASA